MFLPNYHNNSIVNLMSSIITALGGKSMYNELEILRSKEISRAKNVVLIIIDGMGYEFLNKYGKETVIYKNFKTKITSVFPSTTATATTTFATALAPQQHAITGWYMYLKELGIVGVILPFATKAGGIPLSAGKIEVEKIINFKPFFDEIDAKSYFITSKQIIDSPYNIATSKGAERRSYEDLSGFFEQIRNIILDGSQCHPERSKRGTSERSEGSTGIKAEVKQGDPSLTLRMTNRKKYIYAYWPDLDSVMHKKGAESEKAQKHLHKIDKKLTEFLDNINGTDTMVIITADHGLRDSEFDHIIDLKDHPEFVDTLAMPVSGEPRVVYCYVRPNKIKQFENYVKKYFSKYCDMYKSEDLVKRNFYGLYEPNPKLMDRIGDYVLIMKEDYLMKQVLVEQKGELYKAHHGGMTKEEMFVPVSVMWSN